MTGTETAVQPQQSLAKVPGKAWGLLILALFATVAVPLNMFKCPGLAPQLMEFFGMDPSTFGWTMSIYTIMGIILAFPAAGIMRKIGAKMCITLSLAFTILGTLVGVIATDLGVFLFGRFLEGVGMGLVAVATPATLSKWFPRHKRGLALGIWAPWVPIGNIIMLNAANPLADAFGGWQAAWWFGLIYALVFLVLWVIFYKEPDQPILDPGELEDEERAAKKAEAKGGSVKPILTLSMWLIAVGFLIFNVCQQGSLNTFYPTYLGEVHGFSPAEGAFVTSVITMLCIPGAILGGWVSDTLKTRKWVIVVGYVAFAISAIFLFTWTETWQLYIAVGVCGLFGPFATTNVFASSLDIMGPKNNGMGMAIIAFMQNIGSFIGGIALGYMQVAMGWGTASYVLFFPLIIIAILCTIFAKRLR